MRAESWMNPNTSINHKELVVMPTKYADPGTFDKNHRLFLPTWVAFNQKKHDALENWISDRRTAFDWLLANLDKLKRNNRGYCSVSRIRSAFQDNGFPFNNNISTYLRFRIVFLKPELHLFEFRRPEKHSERVPLICPEHHCMLTCPQCAASTR
jgi:hypothetical protein